MKRCAVLLADGFEEIEAVTVINVLRRGHVDVTVVGTNERELIMGAHDVEVGVDEPIDVALDEAWDAIVVPGGVRGAQRLRENDRVTALVRRLYHERRVIAAICAGPIVLSAAGVLKDHAATSYPDFKDEVHCREYREEPVVVDGHVVTSRGPGTAIAFALELVSMLAAPAAAGDVAAAMLTQAPPMRARSV